TTVRAVPSPRGNRTNRVRLTLIGLVAPHARLITPQKMRQSERVRYVGRRSQNRVNELLTAVDRNMRRHPEVPLLALRRLMHLGVTLALLVLRRARRADDRRVHNRALADLDAATGQVLVHGRQQLLAELVPLQQMTELAD